MILIVTQKLLFVWILILTKKSDTFKKKKKKNDLVSPVAYCSTVIIQKKNTSLMKFISIFQAPKEEKSSDDGESNVEDDRSADGDNRTESENNSELGLEEDECSEMEFDDSDDEQVTSSKRGKKRKASIDESSDVEEEILQQNGTDYSASF